MRTSKRVRIARFVLVVALLSALPAVWTFVNGLWIAYVVPGYEYPENGMEILLQDVKGSAVRAERSGSLVDLFVEPRYYPPPVISYSPSEFIVPLDGAPTCPGIAPYERNDGPETRHLQTLPYPYHLRRAVVADNQSKLLLAQTSATELSAYNACLRATPLRSNVRGVSGHSGSTQSAGKKRNRPWSKWVRWREPKTDYAGWRGQI